MTPSSVVVVALVPLIAWRMYRRFRRLVGRQRSRPWRHWAAAILLPLLAVLVALPAALPPDPLALAALAAGGATGIALAAWGLRLTAFEATPEGIFYTPNARIGIAISVLFAARVAWRLAQVLSGGITPASNQAFARSPLTLLVFGLLAGYYAAYAAGILRWRAAHWATHTPTATTP